MVESKCANAGVYPFCLSFKVTPMASKEYAPVISQLRPAEVNMLAVVVSRQTLQPPPRPVHCSTSLVNMTLLGGKTRTPTQECSAGAAVDWALAITFWTVKKQKPATFKDPRIPSSSLQINASEMYSRVFQAQTSQTQWSIATY